MILKSNQIEAARLFTSKKEFRPLCTHSFVINGKLITTDGHAMLVQQLKDCKVNFKKIHIPSIVKGQGIDLSVHDPRVKDLDQVFHEKLSRVIPKETSGLPATFDADILVKIKKAAKLLGVEQQPIQYNGAGASLVQWSDGSFVVVMPMRLKQQENLPVATI